MSARRVLGWVFLLAHVLGRTAWANARSGALAQWVKAHKVAMRAGVQPPVAIMPTRPDALTLERGYRPDPRPGRKEMAAVPALLVAANEVDVVEVGVVAPLTLRHLSGTVREFASRTTFEARVEYADHSTADLGRFQATGLATAHTLRIPLRPGLNRLEVAPVGAMPGNPSRQVEILRRLGHGR